MATIYVEDKDVPLIAICWAEGDRLRRAVGDGLRVQRSHIHGDIECVDLDDTVSVANGKTIRHCIECKPGDLPGICGALAE
jgi:hypothetical protein